MKFLFFLTAVFNPIVFFLKSLRPQTGRSLLVLIDRMSSFLFWNFSSFLGRITT